MQLVFSCMAGGQHYCTHSASSRPDSKKTLHTLSSDAQPTLSYASEGLTAVSFAEGMVKPIVAEAPSRVYFPKSRQACKHLLLSLVNCDATCFDAARLICFQSLSE